MSEAEIDVDLPGGMEASELQEVTPAKWDTRDSRRTRTEFEFNCTYVYELNEYDCSIPQVSTDISGNFLVWEYEGKCPVVITRERVLGPSSAPRKERERQAFFSLSRLDSDGLVSRWRKV